MRKQSAIWRIHSATATWQLGLSVKGGRGLEHHFPQLYSQVGVGVTVAETHLVGEVDEVVVVVLLVIEVVKDVVEDVDVLEVEVVDVDV